MKSTWFNHLKNGLKRDLPQDQIGTVNKPQDAKEVLKRLLPFMRVYWKSGLIGGLLIIFTSLLAFPQPLVYRFLVDDVILARRLDLLSWALLLVIGIKLLDIGAGLLQKYYLLDFEQSVILKIQEALLEHTLHLPKAFFDQNEVGYLISRVSSDVGGLRWFFSGTLVYLFTNLIRFLGGLGFLFYLEWRLALVSLLALPAMLFSVRYFSKRMRILSHHGMETHAGINKRLQETITSLPLIKAFSTEQRESERVMHAFEDQRQISLEQNVVGSLTDVLINLAPDLARGVVLLVGAYLAIQGEWTLGSLFAFQAYLGYVFNPAMYFANANLTLQNALASLERVMNLFDIVPEENLDTGKVIDHLDGSVEFKDVSFSYAGDQQVLKALSFKVKPGERVAVVGPSGVGKTTLVSLILCFYKPTEGEILFDGMPVSEYNLLSLRRRIGYVSQSSLLLSGTFNENLRYGNASASQEAVENAARTAGIHDFIISLPEGYDSRIDERAVNLSEGQKQRLSIARALVKDPDVFILDEPTAALDSIIERSIFDAIPPYVKDKTLFIIAHHLVTIQDADRILLLDDQGVLSIGTHQTLLAENAYYRQLCAQQQLNLLEKSV